MKELTAAISLIYSIPVCRIVSLKEEKVFLVTTKRERYVLKLLPYPAMETGFITDAMNYLSRNGFHDFNEIIPTAAGRPTGEFHGARTLLTKELKGRVPSYKRKEDAMAVAAYLGELHRAADHFFPIHRFEQRIKWGTMIETMEQSRSDLIRFGEEIKEKAKKTDFDHAYLSRYTLYTEETEHAIAGMIPFYGALCEKKRKYGGFCHHDPAHHNFLIDEKGKVGAFDFDYAIADLAAHDTAALLLKILKTNHWDPATALAALRAYEEIAPLCGGERRFLCRLLEFPYDFHHAAFARYAEGDTRNRIEKKLFRLIREEEKRQKALTELKKFLGEGP